MPIAFNIPVNQWNLCLQESRHLKGLLGELRLTKHTYSATLRLQVLAHLMETEDFADETLGIHFLRGEWTARSVSCAGVCTALDFGMIGCLQCPPLTCRLAHTR